MSHSDPGRPRKSHRFHREPERAEEGPLRIHGVHAVEAVLRNARRVVHGLWLTDNALHRMEEAVARRGIEPTSVSPRELDRLLPPDTVHQGALVETESLEEPDLPELLKPGAAGPALIVVLDQVTDPHNVGAIMRSAAAFGASGLVMTARHSPPLSGALAKVASGALELVEVVHVPNLARGLLELGEQGVLRIALDGAADLPIEECAAIDAALPVALVLGAEERGLRHLTRETCDLACRIHTPGTLASLNVSNAAAVALHATRMRQRGLA